MDHNHNDPDEEGSDGLEEVTDNRVGVLGHRRRADGVIPWSLSSSRD